MILMVNGRRIHVTDGKVSYEDARWLAGEVKRLTSILVEATSWATRHNYVNEVYALEQILRRGEDGE